MDEMMIMICKYIFQILFLIHFKRVSNWLCNKVHLYQVWPWSEKNCTHKSSNSFVSTDQWTDNLIPVYPLSTSLSRGIMRWVSLDLIDDSSTLVQIMGSTLEQGMAWCLQAPSHSLNQCWIHSLDQAPSYSLNQSRPRLLMPFLHD